MKPENRKRSLVIFMGILLALLTLLFILLYYVVLKKPPYALTEIERVFPGGEIAFVKTSGVAELLASVGETRYITERGYRPLLETEVFTRFLESVGGAENEWIQDVNLSIVLAFLGYESALGVYASGAEGEEHGRDRAPHLLFVSRVHPSVLLLDRLLRFFDEDDRIGEATYHGRGITILPVDDGKKVLYSLEGDFLILSDDPDIFYAALSRFLDEGEIESSENTAVSLLGKEHTEDTLVSGFIYPDRIPESIGLLLPLGENTMGSIPEMMIAFTAEYEPEQNHLRVNIRRGSTPFPIAAERQQTPRKTLEDDELAFIYNKDFLPSDLGNYDRFDYFFPLRSWCRLFPGEFFVSLIGDPRAPKKPEITVFDFSPAGGSVPESLWGGGEYDILKMEVGEQTINFARVDGAVTLAWVLVECDLEDTLIAGSSTDSVADGMGRFPNIRRRYPEGMEAGLYLEASPRRISEEAAMFPEQFDRVVFDILFSPDDNRGLDRNLDFLAGFYPVRWMGVEAHRDADDASLVIIMELKDGMP
jgi:hypothetical protein